MKETKNKNLHAAKKAKNDEFYTQLTDIEKELRHYKHHFENKVVYCNCDDPKVSNFYRYFAMNFEHLKLKKLICTCYKNTNSDLFSSHNEDFAVKVEYNGDINGNRINDPWEASVIPLHSDGDFRSKECLELLAEADIVCTNPPFSLFREYVGVLMEYKKKFLIIGDQNSITYKEIFKFIKANEIWLGVTNFGNKWFCVPEHYEDIKTETRIKWEDGKRYFSKGSICWFTNLDYKKRHEDLPLLTIKEHERNGVVYPRYDNYDAINIDKTAWIPDDYDGVMGVPITFLDKWNPEQFEIVGKTNSGDHAGEYLNDNSKDDPCAMVNGKKLYHRILIRRKR
jgi:hypothetical protein